MAASSRIHEKHRLSAVRSYAADNPRRSLARARNVESARASDFSFRRRIRPFFPSLSLYARGDGKETETDNRVELRSRIWIRIAARSMYVCVCIYRRIRVYAAAEGGTFVHDGIVTREKRDGFASGRGKRLGASRCLDANLISRTCA